MTISIIAERERMGPIERELREADGDIGQLDFGSKARRMLWGAADEHGLGDDFIIYPPIGPVDADVFSYAIEAAAALGL